MLDSTSLVARYGHESGFSPDGKTFSGTATATPAITASDVTTGPSQPHAIWQGNILAHGMTLSGNGDRAVIEQIGIASRALTTKRGATRRLLSGLR